MSDMSFEFWSVMNQVQELSTSVGWLRREVSEAKKIIAMFVDGEPNARVLAIEYLGKQNAVEHSVQQIGDTCGYIHSALTDEWNYCPGCGVQLANHRNGEK